MTYDMNNAISWHPYYVCTSHHHHLERDQRSSGRMLEWWGPTAPTVITSLLLALYSLLMSYCVLPCMRSVLHGLMGYGWTHGLAITIRSLTLKCCKCTKEKNHPSSRIDPGTNGPLGRCWNGGAQQHPRL